MEHEALLSTWCRTFMHTKERKIVFFLNTLKIPLSPSPREGPFHAMFVRNQHIDERIELTCIFENQDAAKITSASADSRINFSWTDYVTLGAERPSVHVVKPRRKARLVEPMWTCAATGNASLKHQSLRLMREYHLRFQWTILIMRNSDGRVYPNVSRSRHPSDDVHK